MLQIDFQRLQKKIFFLISSADELPRDCETLGNNYKYILGNCYYIEATAYDITESSGNCRDRFNSLGNGGRLFEPKNQITNDAVLQEARTVTTRLNFVLGIQDSNSQNNWQYISSNKNVSWFNWLSGQPNNDNGNQEDCVCNIGAYSDYKWGDIPCSSKCPSICEMTTEGILVYFTSTIVTCGLYFFNPLFKGLFT